MDDLIDMIANDESPSEISDKIKQLLFVKASEKIDTAAPYVADNMFNFEPDGSDETDETEE
jgi:hypothetical protein